MMTMPRELMIFPVVALFMWTFGVGIRFVVLSVKAAKKSPGDPTALNSPPHRKPPNELAMNNVSNLFEVPTLFYVFCAFVFAADSVDRIFLYGAWLYVIVRVVHSYIHVTYNYLPHRLAAFMTSNLVLTALWLRFAFAAWQRMA